MSVRQPFIPMLVDYRFFAMLPVTVSAQETVVVETISATTYLNGGIGQEEEAAIRRVAKEFSLRITFSERRDGKFLSDIPVVIADARGNLVFELFRAGPMLDVMLPNGKYKVSARFKGITQSQEVTLYGKGGKDLNFHWKEKPNS